MVRVRVRVRVKVRVRVSPNPNPSPNLDARRHRRAAAREDVEGVARDALFHQVLPVPEGLLVRVRVGARVRVRG